MLKRTGVHFGHKNIRSSQKAQLTLDGDVVEDITRERMYLELMSLCPFEVKLRITRRSERILGSSGTSIIIRREQSVSCTW